MADGKYCTAIVLAAGQGSRMKSSVQKQYLDLNGKPVLYYSLRAFETSELVDEILLVTGEGQVEYCKEEIVEKYALKKVKEILVGGKERYESVYHALCAMEMEPDAKEGVVLIHDGARPFVDGGIIERAYSAAVQYGACVIGMPVKDTIKIADDKKFAQNTPDRSLVWMIQTPQAFEWKIVKKAYDLMMQEHCTQVTDDAMVVEQMLGHPVKLIEGSYNNMKITTPEDLPIAETLMRMKNEEGL